MTVERPLQKPPGYGDSNAPPLKPVKLNLPSSVNPKKRDHCFSCRVLCCTTYTVIAILILILISLGSLFYLYYRPCLPEMHVTSIAFGAFNVSTTQDGSALSSRSTLFVEFKNSNEYLKMEYGESIRISLNALNGDVSLGQQIFPGFTQERGNFATLKAVMNVRNEILDDISAMRLKKGLKGTAKNVMVNAEIKTGIRLKGSVWSSGLVQIVARCDEMSSSSYGHEGDIPKCRVKFFHWIT